jgi:hypothetical protein
MTVATGCGRTAAVWELKHRADPTVLSDWASHFRQHYCKDQDLSALVAGTGKTNAEFLRELKFPSRTVKPGPSIRSGDFGEILVADYLRYVLGYWSPHHLRYLERFSPNESTKGADVIGFRYDPADAHQPADELYLFEAKAGFRPNVANRLQNAVTDSGKDALREATTLHALKQRLLKDNDVTGAQRVQRFQDETARPFKRRNGAAAVLDDDVYAATNFTEVDTTTHPNSANLDLIVIKGPAMMDLVHALYERAADEA